MSIQAQIINLLEDLQHQFNLAYLFISHDLSVVQHISDTVAVMYLGNIVEFSDRDEIFSNPLHPYTKALFSHPDSGSDDQTESYYSSREYSFSGKSCKFHTRCAYAMKKCETVEPVLRDLGNGHIRCLVIYLMEFKCGKIGYKIVTK